MSLPLTQQQRAKRKRLAAVAAGASVTARKPEVAVTKVHDITVDVTGTVSLQDIRVRVQEVVETLHGVARVTLHGELAPDVDLRPRDLAVPAKTLDSLTGEVGDLYVAYNFEVIKDEATVRGEFVRQVTSSDLPEDEKRRVLVTGLRALDGREDLEVT